jgi:hypothetical protein
MDSRPKLPLEERVSRSADAILAERNHVSALDVLIGMGWLQHVHLEQWSKGRLAHPEEMIQANRDKVCTALRFFGEWALARGLEPVHKPHFSSTLQPQELQFTIDGDKEREALFLACYARPDLSEADQNKLRAELGKRPELVVFWLRRDSQCSKCGNELGKGQFLLMDGQQPLCLKCAGLSDLVFLGAGDAKLTRRARKYSARSAVVVRFSRTRGRYERQGLLVEEEALKRAEAECGIQTSEA